MNTAVQLLSAKKELKKKNTYKETVLKSQRRFIVFSLLPIAVLFIIFSIVPIFTSIIISLFNYDGVGRPIFIGFQNYIQMFSDLIFKKALINTFFFVVVSVGANIIISTLMATAIVSVGNKNVRDFLRGLFFMPTVVPVVALCYVWIIMYEPNFGIINQVIKFIKLPPINWLSDANFALLSVIITTLWCDLGYNIILIMAGLEGIPKMFYEAASIDGANEVQTFFKITLPLLGRTMLFVTIMTFISYFQVFAQIQIMTGGGPDNASIVLAFYVYQNAFQFMRMGYASAVAVIMLLIILVVSVVQLVSVKIDWEY